MHKRRQPVIKSRLPRKTVCFLTVLQMLLYVFWFLQPSDRIHFVLMFLKTLVLFWLLLTLQVLQNCQFLQDRVGGHYPPNIFLDSQEMQRTCEYTMNWLRTSITFWTLQNHTHFNTPQLQKIKCQSIFDKTKAATLCLFLSFWPPNPQIQFKSWTSAVRHVEFSKSYPGDNRHIASNSRTQSWNHLDNYSKKYHVQKNFDVSLWPHQWKNSFIAFFKFAASSASTRLTTEQSMSFLAASSKNRSNTTVFARKFAFNKGVMEVDSNDIG